MKWSSFCLRTRPGWEIAARSTSTSAEAPFGARTSEPLGEGAGSSAVSSRSVMSGSFHHGQRLVGRGQKRLGADRRSRRLLHPDVRRQVADPGHALELAAEVLRLLDLLLDLERNEVADRIVRQIEERVDH